MFKALRPSSQSPPHVTPQQFVENQVGMRHQPSRPPHWPRRKDRPAACMRPQFDLDDILMIAAIEIRRRRCAQSRAHTFSVSSTPTPVERAVVGVGADSHQTAMRVDVHRRSNVCDSLRSIASDDAVDRLRHSGIYRAWRQYIALTQVCFRIDSEASSSIGCYPIQRCRISSRRLIR
jgi:hypothetical protein